MSDLVRNPEDRFSKEEAHIKLVFFQDKLLKPLGGYVGYNTEWRELAQNISRVSM